jgi:hypothetical protein
MRSCIAYSSGPLVWSEGLTVAADVERGRRRSFSTGLSTCGRTRLMPLTVLCWLILALSCSLSGGPLFPCVKVVSSKDGNFLVVLEDHSLDIISKERFINPPQRMTAPATFWTSGAVWSVPFTSFQIHNEPECPLPLITDDGEFVILVSTGPVLGRSAPVLTIFRRRDHRGDPMREGPDHGVFIKSILIDEIWPPDKFAVAWDDETPEWFAGGRFDFSANLRELIHTTRWGETVRIDLATGTIIPTRRQP